MRFLIIGDQHFRYQLPYANTVADGRKAEWSAVISTIHTASHSCDAVVLLGDNLNSRHNHSSVLAEFVSFLDGFGDKELHIIAGNHERYGKETAIDFLKGVNKNWKIYTEPTISVIRGVPVVMFPFMTPAAMDKETLTEAREYAIQMAVPAHYLFHHHIIEGTVVGGANLDELPEIVFPRTIEGRYKKIFGGHIHQPQVISEKTCVTGNIFSEQVGDSEKFIYVLDTDTEETERIALPVRKIEKIHYSAGYDLLYLSSDNIYRILITDKQLHGVGVDAVKRYLGERNIPHIITEQYDQERTQYESSDGELNLSLDNLLAVYSGLKNVPLEQLKRALDFVNTHENNRH